MSKILSIYGDAINDAILTSDEELLKSCEDQLLSISNSLFAKYNECNELLKKIQDNNDLTRSNLRSLNNWVDVSIRKKEKQAYVDKKYGNTKLLVKSIDNILDIPDTIYHYDGDIEYKPGLYTKIGNLIVRIPEVNTICTKNHKKHKVYKCKVKNCTDINCKNYHSGDKIKKISSNSISNCHTLDKDLRKLSIEDARKLALYTITDFMGLSIYFNSEAIDDNLDVAL